MLFCVHLHSRSFTHVLALLALPGKKKEKKSHLPFVTFFFFFSIPLLFLSPAPRAHILHYEWLDDPTGVA